MAHPAIQKLLEKLRKYTDVKYLHTEDSIMVTPSDRNGFIVSLVVRSREFVVFADGWHEHFKQHEEEDALNCFAFLLSDACRLKIEYRGVRPTRWTIESLQAGSWIGDSVTGKINLDFLSTKHTTYFQNCLIKMEGLNRQPDQVDKSNTEH